MRSVRIGTRANALIAQNGLNVTFIGENAPHIRRARVECLLELNPKFMLLCSMDKSIAGTDQVPVWPPAPDKPAPNPITAEPGNFAIAGIRCSRDADRLVVDNPRLRAGTGLFLLTQIVVLAFTVFVQWESMLWFQNVWRIHGSAVILETALQAAVWLAMAFAYGYYTWVHYNQHCRFRATFDRADDLIVEGAQTTGPLAALTMVEVRPRASLFAHWFEVRLLIHTDDGDRYVDPFRLRHRLMRERTLASMRSMESAERLARTVAEYVGIPIRHAIAG
jgi:hypothetical protein